MVLVLFGLGVGLYAAAGGASAPDGSDFTLGALVAGLAFGLPGAILVRRSDVPAIGWVCLAAGLSLALSAVLTVWAVYGISTDPGSLPATEAAMWLSNWCWVPGYGLVITVLLLLLPDGDLATRSRRALAALSGVAITVAAAGMALSTYPLHNLPRAFAGHTNPAVVAGLGDGLSALSWLLVPCVLGSLGSLVWRYRRAPTEQREQLRWVALGGVFTIALFALALALGPSGDVVFALAMVPLPACVTFAVLRHGLWNVDVVINRSLVYGTLSATAVLTYVALASLLSRAVGGIVAVIVIALALVPLHRWVQSAVNRLLYGERDDPAATLRRLGDRLTAAGEVDEILPAAAESVARALRLPYVAVRLPEGGGGSHGRPAGSPVALELRYRGAPVGELLASPRAAGGRLSGADERALEAIGRQLAVAAHSVTLTHELQRSRERIVVAREEERRRVRAELHDGLGPTLAALALQLELAREQLDSEPERASEKLDQLTVWAQDTVGDVRRIVHDLRPASLDDLGLVGSLREQAERLCAGGLNVEVHSSESLDSLPAAVEVAAFRIVSEALANVVRHAAAHRCAVELTLGDEALTVNVSDDGRGLPAERHGGVGLRSMRERAEELGGTFAVGARPEGGTAVTAVLPVRAR